MEKFVEIIEFIAKWLLFAFPLYQAYIELIEQQKFLNKIVRKSKKYPKISPWYWVIPPLKITLEKKRGLTILSEGLISKRDFEDSIIFGRKATAWFYVSIAGLLEGVAAVYEVFHSFGYQISYFKLVFISVLVAAICIINIRNRIKKINITSFKKKLKQIKKES
ncbi:hypothetical protein [Lactococcus lactis]|uniref:hypothetical protein n=1 Tax=Lactococcus lactis TaxID=1358 RepID=UPI0024A7AB89|nr:hypothetical protein [Lactococcus lactis]